MFMKKKESKIAILLYTLGILSCVIFFFTKLVFFIILSVILLLLSSLFQKHKNRIIMYTLLIIFFIGLGYFLFFEPLFRRQGLMQDWDFKIFIKNIITESNLIPFKTIRYYIYNIFNYKSAYKLSLDTFGLFLNFFGNLLCLIPLAILLPLCNDKLKKPQKYITTILLISVLMEIVQIITGNGIFDIDDIILNAGGSIITFYIVNPHIINLIENILLKEKNKLNIAKIITRLFIILICSIVLIFGYNYRKQLELDYVNFISNYDIKIVYKKNECNNEVKDYFYEDELYKYYLTCHSIKDTTIFINDEAYSVEEVFNNKTDYFIELDRFIEAGLITQKEEKYERIKICGMLGSRLSFSYNATEIVYFEYINVENKNNETCTNIFMIPQKNGSAKANFYIEKSGAETTKLTYEFVVKDNKIKTYKLLEKSTFYPKTDN